MVWGLTPHKIHSLVGCSSEIGKNNSKRNALKTGLSAKTILPEQDDNSDQQVIEERWRNDCHPKGVWEEKLIRDLSFLDRKDAILEKLERAEFSALEEAAGDVFGVFDGDLKLPIDGLDLPVQRGWVCERLTVRATSSEDRARTNTAREQRFNQGAPVPGFQSANANNENGRSLEVQAELGSAMDRILRYRTAIRRERFKNVQALHAAQAQRREREREERERKEGEKGKKSVDS